MREGKVYLAGGGCGSADLVTYRALSVLQECEVVVYDSLVSEELLQWTRPDCEKIYVGKRCGSHAMKQAEINALLIKKAGEGKTVVRLKGGDPYVFGRGGEEFMAVSQAGICCEEIPGITSAIGAPAAAGIPVTHRGLSDSVTVVTGTVTDENGHPRLKMDFHVLAQLDGTLVILMGMRHLAEIVSGLLAAGKHQNTPCAIIMEGATRRQRVLRALLYELPARAAKEGFTSPAVIVVGSVAKLELLMERGDGAFHKKPESNKAEAEHGGAVLGPCTTVGVTGTEHFARKLSSVLCEKGISTWDMSFMEIMPAKEALPDFSDYGWLVFTSPNGVGVFLQKMREERRDLRSLYDKKIAVIGPGTAAALQEAGIYADYMPAVYDVAHLAKGLADKILADGKEGKSGKAQTCKAKQEAMCPAIFLRASKGSDSLPLIFQERGIPYGEFALYALTVQEQKRDAVLTKEPDYMVFGSALGARAYFEGLAEKGLQNTKSQYVCMGEPCGREVQKYGNTPPLIAGEASVDGVAACLCRQMGKEDSVCIDSED